MVLHQLLYCLFLTYLHSVYANGALLFSTKKHFRSLFFVSDQNVHRNLFVTEIDFLLIINNFNLRSIFNIILMEHSRTKKGV